MTIPIEELRRGITSLGDRELLTRWHSKLFTEEALPIAEEEINRRGLDTSLETAQTLRSEYDASVKLHKRKSWTNIGKGCLTVVLIVIGSVAATIAAIVMR